MSRRGERKFFIHAPNRSGEYKGRRLMGINRLYNGDKNNVTVKDMIAFLKEKGIDPSTVPLPHLFMTYTLGTQRNKT